MMPLGNDRDREKTRRSGSRRGRSSGGRRHKRKEKKMARKLLTRLLAHQSGAPERFLHRVHGFSRHIPSYAWLTYASHTYMHIHVLLCCTRKRVLKELETTSKRGPGDRRRTSSLFTARGRAQRIRFSLLHQFLRHEVVLGHALWQMT